MRVLCRSPRNTRVSRASGTLSLSRYRPLSALVCLIPLVFFLVPVLLGPSQAIAGEGRARGPHDAHGTSVLILIDGIELNDFVKAGSHGKVHIPDSLGGLKRLAEVGSIALMNVRTAGAYNPESARLTLGAGSRAAAPPGSFVLRGVDERLGVAMGGSGLTGEFAGEVYSRRMGRAAPGNGFVVLDMAPMIRANTAFHYSLRPGALGQALHEAGRRITLLAPTLPAAPLGMLGGEARAEGIAGAVSGVPGAAVAMDTAGVVRSAVVGSALLERDPQAALGWRTDAEALLSAMDRYWGRTDLFVVDLPDGRLHMRARRRMTGGAAADTKRRAVRSLNQVVENVLARADLERDWVLLAVLTPDPQGRLRGHMLTPLFMAGPGISEGGWLSSPTTRRPGLVTLTDLAPTLLAQQGVDPGGAILGRPISSTPHRGSAIADLVAANRRMVATYVQRPPLLKCFVTFQIVVWVVGLALLLAAGRLPDEWRRRAAGWLQWTLLVTMSLPLLLLLVSPGHSPNAWVTGAASVLGALLFSGVTRLIAARRRIGTEIRSLIPIYIISLVTALALVVDLGRGAVMMQASVLGYDPIVGARYYGIGNEYMGILIGATLVGATALEDRMRRAPPGAPGFGRAATIVLFAVTLCAVSLPWWGANVGGALAAAVGTAFTTFLLFKGRASLRDLAWALVFAAVTLALLTAIDLLRPGTPSHLGRLALSVADRGLEPFINVVRRKVEINLRLFQYSIWSRAFAIALVILILQFVRPSPLFRRLNGRFPSLFKGVRGATVAGVVAFAVNDSGVIAAATTTLYASGALLYLAWVDQLHGEGRADRAETRKMGR